MRVGYLGPEGTFSHEALLAWPLAEGADAVPLATVHDTVMAVQAGDVDRAIVPIENSLEGAVNAALDA
ncbi:MAG: prephenate dehydratase, partial [Solirubrobacteraceae bacterium]|nr:prephenate dehydratase [Solirubrobacteraceae bacterium]